MRHLSLMLLLLLSSKPMLPDDRHALCPLVSTRVLKDAPPVCLQAGVQARMEQLERTLQRLREQVQHLAPRSGH